MLGSVGFGEVLLILLVALIVFGPHRLPEIARKAGELMARARQATKDLTDSIDAEYSGAVAPLRDLKDEYERTKQQLTESVNKVIEQPTDTPADPEPAAGPDGPAEDEQADG